MEKLIYLPSAAIFTDSLSSWNDSVSIIAGAACAGHTLALLVHVGSFRTAAAVHWDETDLTGEVRLAEGTAATPTAGHVVAIHGFCCTQCTEFLCWDAQDMWEHETRVYIYKQLECSLSKSNNDWQSFAAGKFRDICRIMKTRKHICIYPLTSFYS